jgi:hypothetical protein
MKFHEDLDAAFERVTNNLCGQITASYHRQRLWIWGLYGLLILRFFIHR